MARGRMISKSLSTSEKRAALHQTAGKLAEFCQAIYPLLVAHADDWGCLQGDVFTVKHMVDPTSPRKLEEFKSALVALHNVGLITWYQSTDQKWVVYIRSFIAHQNLRGHDKDGRKRQYEAPPENPSKIEDFAQKRPEVPKSALREEKRTELKGTEPIRSPNESGTAQADGKHDENREIAAFIKAFCEVYAKHRHGARYFIKREKHIPLIRALLKTYGAERLEKLAMVLLNTDDEWVHHTDRGIEILSVKASWLDNRLSEYEAQHGVIRGIA